MSINVAVGAQNRTTRRTWLSLNQLRGCWVILFMDSHHSSYMIAKRIGCIGYRSCLCCVTMIAPVHEWLYHVEVHLCQAKEVYHAWGQQRALTLVKQSGLRWSNMLGHGTDCECALRFRSRTSLGQQQGETSVDGRQLLICIDMAHSFFFYLY